LRLPLRRVESDPDGRLYVLYRPQSTVGRVEEAQFEPRPLTELEKERLAAIRSEVMAIAEAARSGDLTEESLKAGIEALRQIPCDPVRVLDAIHVPDDAGEHRAGLERILRRIPDGWGRWIGCGPGWYPIIVDLADAIAELVPEYEIHQVKEKYGTLRFYWGVPYRDLACCAEFHQVDPRPFPGASIGPFAPKDRDPEESRRLQEWFRRYDAHLASVEHKRVNEAAYVAAEADQDHARSIDQRIEALIDVAEEVSARTCERCGSPGVLHEDHGWLATLCASCAAESGFLLPENP